MHEAIIRRRRDAEVLKNLSGRRTFGSLMFPTGVDNGPDFIGDFLYQCADGWTKGPFAIDNSGGDGRLRDSIEGPSLSKNLSRWRWLRVLLGVLADASHLKHGTSESIYIPRG
jgi:hypothetical protein